jgi:large subunit ribosomal protein L31
MTNNHHEFYSFNYRIMKKWIHAPYYQDVEVNCICGASFKINATVPGPIKVETCYQCHPAFNENKEVKKVIKWRMEKFLEKQEAIKAAQAKKSA